MFCIRIATFVVLFANLALVQSAAWNYQDFAKWNEINELCANAEHQSPIDVERKAAELDENLAKDKLVFVNYDSNYDGQLINNGHTGKLPFIICPNFIVTLD